MQYVRFDKRLYSRNLAIEHMTAKACTPGGFHETPDAWIFEIDPGCATNDIHGSIGVTVFKDSAPVDVVYKAGAQSSDDPMEFVLSDETVDRMGDIIRADGWKLSAFRKNPIALFGHNHHNIIGVWKNVRVEGKRLLARLKFAKEGTSELVDTTRKLVEQRILKAVSVGFMPTKGEPRDPDKPWNGFDFTESELHEGSLVAVPANPNALAVAKAFSPAVADQLFIRSDEYATRVKECGEFVGRLTSLTETPNLTAARKRAREMGIDI